MKKQLIAAVIILMLASFACSFQNLTMETTETKWVNISENLPPNTNETELVFKMTGGSFSLNPGAQGLVNGSIMYNVEQWEPELTRRDNYFEIKQVDPFRFSGIPSGDIENNWDLSLTTVLPINLTIEGGGSENSFNFTDLQLTNLKVVQGASKTTLRFDTPNLLVMENLSFTTGASSAELLGLGNANFKTMKISCGAGDYTLDFSGGLSHDADVDIKAGVSNMKIIIPAGTNAIVNNQGTISNINTKGTWMLTNDTYATLQDGFILTINLNMAVGNVSLIHEE
ncbi:MAG: toast rack family protein [Anaerolineales bacterium]